MNSLEYLNPQSTQTLREGIAELRAAEGDDHDAAECMAPELLNDIDTHDAIHVLFGCPTDLEGEIVAHAWTVFGTTVSLRDMHRVNEHRDHREALRQIGHRTLLKTWIRSVPRILRTFVNARRMTKRWPVEEIADFVDRPLDELRKEFAIQLICFESGQPRAGGAALRGVSFRRAGEAV